MLLYMIGQTQINIHQKYMTLSQLYLFIVQIINTICQIIVKLQKIQQKYMLSIVHSLVQLLNWIYPMLKLILFIHVQVRLIMMIISKDGLLSILSRTFHIINLNLYNMYKFILISSQHTCSYQITISQKYLVIFFPMSLSTIS